MSRSGGAGIFVATRKAGPGSCVHDAILRRQHESVSPVSTAWLYCAGQTTVLVTLQDNESGAPFQPAAHYGESVIAYPGLAGTHAQRN